MSGESSHWSIVGGGRRNAEKETPGHSCLKTHGRCSFLSRLSGNDERVRLPTLILWAAGQRINTLMR
jgi:hypothetical protein